MPTKNSQLSMGPAYADLGLGDALRSQLQDQEEEARQRKLLGSNSAASTLGLGGSGTGY